MKKRVISFTACILFMLSCLTVRLFVLTTAPQQASSQSSTRVKDIGVSRGFIYDRGLSPLTNTDIYYTACILPTQNSISFLKNKEDNETLKMLSEGLFVFKRTNHSTFYNECEDILLLKCYNRKQDNSLAHIIGYTDDALNGVCGLEKYYNEYFKSTGGSLSVAYNADSLGRVLTNERTEIRNNGYYNTQGLVLTIDKTIQSILENALKNNNITQGAGIILNTQTGEILGCASTPSYDINNLEYSLNDKGSPFINRAFSAYPVGSVFKIVTAAAAFEKGYILDDYFCNGSITFNATTFNCNALNGHKNLNLEDAISKSCNTYFIKLGVDIGGENLIDTARLFRFGVATDFGNGFKTDSGILPDSTDLVSNADVANLAFGQGKLTATPLQVATMLSVIGSNGFYIEPTLIKGKLNNNGDLYEESEINKVKIIGQATCKAIKNGLEKTVANGTGTKAQSQLLECCAKTATAQSGQFDKNGKEIMYCWFAGFFPKENPQYTICIMKENGSSGGSDCGPVFKEIAENILLNF